MEIADIFVVNKADRDGADRMATELRMLLHMHAKTDWWDIPVLTTQAHRNVGIAELSDAIATHRQTLQRTGNLTARRRDNRRKELLELLQQRLLAQLQARMEREGELHRLVARVQETEIDPYTAAQQILDAQPVTWG
jgi:LAO/AO transport system kinase